MRLNRRKTALLGLLAIGLYLPVTNAMIDHSAHQLTERQFCVGLYPPQHTAFLRSMGARSLSALHRELAAPNLKFKTKVRIADLAYELGDKAQFSLFLEGARSSDQKIRDEALIHLAKYPQECLQNLPAILQLGRKPYDKRHSSLFRAMYSAQCI